MTRKTKLCKASNGLFVRNIGWKRTSTGYAQHKFYLGRDETKAKLVCRRLEQLWQEACNRWEQETRGQLDGPAMLQYAVELPTISDGQAEESGVSRPQPTATPLLLADLGERSDRPIWTDITLAIAEAIRNGEAVARVPLPLPLAATSPASRSNCRMRMARPRPKSNSRSTASV